MSSKLKVESVHELEPGKRWRGMLQYPDRPSPQAILIFTADQGFLGISAYCPHEGFDLSEVPLQEDGSLICPIHGLCIQIQQPCSNHFVVQPKGAGFEVPWPFDQVSIHD